MTCGFKVECDIAKRLEECSTRASVAVFTLDPHVRDMVYDACGRFKSASDLRNATLPGPCYGMFAVNGILFNHESPRRGETFVTRKITRAIAAIKAGRQEHLYLGNIDSIRDWGYAPEFVEGMWRMLQVDEPDDFVLATGVKYSVRDFLDMGFSFVGLNWEDHVRSTIVICVPRTSTNWWATPGRPRSHWAGRRPC